MSTLMRQENTTQKVGHPLPTMIAIMSYQEISTASDK